MRTILITGGSGLLGRYVVGVLRERYRIVVLDIKPPVEPDEYLHGDILDLPLMIECTRGIDAIVHLAAIPHPLNHPAEEVVRLNVMGTFHLLEAAARNGVRTFIFASSESTLGFAFAERKNVPDYVPVDEDHPLRPQDPYGMSKVLCEEMCKTYTRRYGMQTLCLRMPWIWVPEPEEQKLYRSLIDEYPKWYKNLWAFVHGMDAADAFARGLERGYRDEHRAWFINADENWTGTESVGLVRRFFPDTVIFKNRLPGTVSLITNNKAKTELGFRPQRTVRDVFSPVSLP
jgi:UDP-glucose 4-epimerase